MVTHEADIAQFAERKVTFRDGRILTDERVKDRRSSEGDAIAASMSDEKSRS